MPVAHQDRVPVQSSSAPVRSRLPTLLAESDESYRAQPIAFAVSYLMNVLVAIAFIWSGNWFVSHRTEIKQRVVSLVTDESPYVLPPANTETGGGGGGGDSDKLRASKGSPPEFAKEQFAPPEVVIHNQMPLLPTDPTVIGPPKIQFSAGPTGDPLSGVLGPPSNGTGYGGGIGSGSGGGVGSGRGPGVGPGEWGGIGGGTYRVGGGVSAPQTIFAPDPEYSEEARKAKFQGSVILWMIVGADGLPHEIRIARSLGRGLDEKALEAVKTWRFEPGRKDGHPVNVEINVEVSFRLY